MLRIKPFIVTIFCIVLMVFLTVQEANTPVFAFTSNTSNTSGIPKQIAGGKKVKLVVDFSIETPTINQKVTADNTHVVTAAQKLADEFMKLYPNVTIQWCRTSIERGNENAFSQWLTTSIAGGTAPHIAYTGGSRYDTRGWYMNLTGVMNKPNEFIPGNKKWKDIFPEYLFKDPLTINFKNEIVAIPYTLFPGPPTAYYYNKEIFKKVGVSVPKDWEEFIQVCKKIKAAGYLVVGPYAGNKQITTSTWDMQFSLGRLYMDKVKDKVDTNHDGAISQLELLEYMYGGNTLITTNKNFQEMFSQMKRKYTEVLDTGYANRDFEIPWVKGKLAMMEDGLWRLPNEMSNTKRKFEFGMFPPPVITPRTSKYVSDPGVTKSGPSQPFCRESFNILEPSIKAQGGEAAREAAVAFLKFTSTPKNISTMVLEQKGGCIGAVKGSSIPPELNDWFKNSFPKLPPTGWPNFAAKGTKLDMNKPLEMWVNGMIDEKEFYNQFDAAFKDGAEAWARENPDYVKGWKRGW